MSTRADNAETLAVRAALGAFAERLNRELHALNDAELAELDESRHQHMSLLVSSGGRSFVVVTSVHFTSNPAVVENALRMAKGKASA